MAEAARNNVGSVCTALATLLGPRTLITHGLQRLMGGILSTMHCRSQHCLELLHLFAHHCQHARNNSQHCLGATMLGVIASVCTQHYIAYRILLSRIVCDIAVLLLLVVAVSCLAFWRFGETIRVILFIDDSLGLERWYAVMLSFFIKFPASQCLMMYDDRY